MPSIDTPKIFGDRQLSDLVDELKQAVSVEEKLTLLSKTKNVVDYLTHAQKRLEMVSSLSPQNQLVFYSILSVGQGERIFADLSAWQLDELEAFLAPLVPIETFYRHMGGVLGYHQMCLTLLSDKKGKKRKGTYHLPDPIDISEATPRVGKQMLDGIAHLDQLAEIYPIGGAADRLSLKNERGELQIAATLEFCGRTLVERLIDDLQAREFLHFKLFGRCVHVPVVMMTSDEKHGAAEIRAFCKEKNWFNRKETDFFLFTQPLVPTMNTQGEWILLGSKALLLKPGGHGVIWKLMQEMRALAWLKDRGIHKVFLRQINNPIAGVDGGLLAFLGIGLAEDKDFGFASCPHIPGAKEGINVVVETDEGFSLTNIEYCDFDQYGIDEKEEMSFLSNTNLLFVDLKAIEELVSRNPIPGMLVNAKEIYYWDSAGVRHQEKILRLESTMQNLADALIEPVESPYQLQRSYITTHRREKTISTMKKEFALGSSMLQTPEQCYLDMLANAKDLLTQWCDYELPALHDPVHFFRYGPSFIFHYPPALGPCYSIIGQKMRKGRLAMGSELKLWIADLYVENLDLDGSLQIVTDSMMGHVDGEGVLQYSHQTGKCILRNVTVRNSGIHREATRSFWKGEVVRKESCDIFIEEGGEFYAEDVVLRGDLHIRVPSGVKVTAVMREGRLELRQEVLAAPSWYWEYSVDRNHQICLALLFEEPPCG